jgi:hypothetical protein
MTFHFGKYRGRDIEEIRFRDPQYVKWAIETVEGFRLAAEKSAEAYAGKSRKPKGKRKSQQATVKTDSRSFRHRPAAEWRDDRVNTVLDAITADPILAYYHPREMHMATDWTPNIFAAGDEPPY